MISAMQAAAEMAKRLMTEGSIALWFASWSQRFSRSGVPGISTMAAKASQAKRLDNLAADTGSAGVQGSSANI
jgi:hypothetical protein